MSGALAGVRVLEFSQVVAAPFLGCVLADLGADVVKVEPPDGDQHRRWGAIVPNEGKRFQSLNRNKRGIAIDLGRPAGADLARRLVPHFDVVTQNLRPGAAARYGLDYETLRELRPDLVYCEITGWGHGGPLSDRTATDPTMTAYAGLIAAGAKIGSRGRTAAPRRLGAGGLLGGLLRRRGHPRCALPPRAHGRGPARRGLAAARLTRDPGHRGDARAGQRRADARPDDRGGTRDPRPRRQLRGDPRCAGGAATVGHGGAARLQPRLPHHRRPDHARRDHASHARAGTRGAGDHGRPRRRPGLRRLGTGEHRLRRPRAWPT